MALEYLQNYWWCLIAVLGGLLVFLLFVQGGQSMLLFAPSKERKELIVNSMGRKWELTFTTLVTFGGAFFASFPLFYSTSFGGAYWLWMLILFSFIVQAVSYEYRGKPGNIYGTKTYDTFLFINGCIGCLLLGVQSSHLPSARVRTFIIEMLRCLIQIVRRKTAGQVAHIASPESRRKWYQTRGNARNRHRAPQQPRATAAECASSRP